MKINGKTVIGDYFVWDGCHKIYVVEDMEDVKEANEYGYTELIDIGELEEYYNNSCPLRFINNWKLTVSYVDQFEEDVVFR